MQNNSFSYKPISRTVVFTDSLKKGSPFIFKIPRNHESLFFVTKGNLLYEREGVRQTFAEGQVGYIPRGFKDKSSAYMCDSVSYIAINFNFEEKLELDHLCSTESSYKYKTLFNDALKTFKSNHAGKTIACNGILLQIIGHLYSEKEAKLQNIKPNKKVDAAIEYLHNNFDRADFEIKTLSQLSNMSEKNFRRIFFKIYGKTPYQLLRELRISKAKILLTNTAKSVTDIALECGFSDVYSFNHSFKSFTGISPTKYKNNL